MKKIKYVIRETGESFDTVELALDVYIHWYAERYNERFIKHIEDSYTKRQLLEYMFIDTCCSKKDVHAYNYLREKFFDYVKANPTVLFDVQEVEGE